GAGEHYVALGYNRHVLERIVDTSAQVTWETDPPTSDDDLTVGGDDLSDGDDDLSACGDDLSAGGDDLYAGGDNLSAGEKKALTNSVDPDETPHDAASHLGLHCLL
ncbi:hypothetical protein DPMN_098719, partial [Dreissena polymorpha]